jgi:diguanylate cyclase (GGDEF)-like protein
MSAAARSGAPLAVAVLDLDRFKDFNDRYGHQTGDRLLKEATAAWRASLRAEHLFARYGGEEFSLLMAGTTRLEATAALERLRAVTPLGQTFSAGLALWDGSESADALFARADEALYEAKRAGRDRVVVWGQAGATTTTS